MNQNESKGFFSSITQVKGRKQIDAEERETIINRIKDFVTSTSAEIGYQDEYGFEYTYKPKALDSNQFLSTVPSGCFYTVSEGDDVTLYCELSSSRFPFYAAMYGVFMGGILPMFGAPPQTFYLFLLMSIGGGIMQRFKLNRNIKNFFELATTQEQIDLS